MSLRTTVLILLSFTVLSANNNTVNASRLYQNITGTALYLKDETKKMELGEVSALADEDFFPLGADAGGFGFNDHAYWFRFHIENKTQTGIKRLLVFEPPWLDRVDAAIVSASGETVRFKGGDNYPFSTRDFRYPKTVFELTVPPGTSTLVVRLETRDPFVVVMELWEEDSFYQNDSVFSVYIGFLYGVLLAMMVYNLFLFFAIRDRLYAFYVLYIACFVAMNFTYSGYSFFLFWPESPEWGNWAHSVSIYLYTLSGLLFAMVFLDTKRQLPRVHRAVLGYFAVVLAVFVISSITGGYAHNVATSILFVVLFSMIAFLMGIVSWLNGNRTARFFILATTAGLFGAAVTAFTVLSILPFHFITYRAVDLGMILDAMFLSLALADRYKSMERERDALRYKEEKQQELLEQKEAFARNLEARVQEELQKNRRQEAVMLKQYQQAALGNMIGVIAHQLKQPLNAINLYIQDLSESFSYGETDPKNVEKAKKNIMESVDFMSLTIDDFRNYFRPDKSIKVFDLERAVRKVVTLFANQITKGGVDLRVSGSEAVALESYESELQQVLLNLVGNALDVFEEKKIPNPRLEIKFEKSAGEVMLTVCDNGGGIPESALSHMFELYYTTKGERGTGIGLYMSRMLVTESLGGEISVRNGENGACFTIRIPVKA